MGDDPDAIPLTLLEQVVDHGLRVRAAREAAKLTIFELAEQTGIPVYRLAAFEAGRASPGLAEAEVIGQATGIPADLFVLS